MEDLPLFLSRLDVVSEILVDFTRHPTPDLELVFKDDAGVKHTPNKIEQTEGSHTGTSAPTPVLR